MSEFESTDGSKVALWPSGALGVAHPDGRSCVVSEAAVAPLAEYFRAAEDARLGRWRWPENPDYVVYRTSLSSRVRVLRETGVGDLEWVDRGDERSYEFCHAARAYFDAHPEPKPWCTAVPGEIWALTVEGHESAWNVEKTTHVTTPGGLTFTRHAPIPRPFVGPSYVGADAPAITAGRRIWPEATS